MAYKIILTKERGSVILSVTLFGSVVGRRTIPVAELTEATFYEAIAGALGDAEIADQITPAMLRSIADQLQMAGTIRKKKSEARVTEEDISQILHNAKKKSKEIVSKLENIDSRLEDIQKELE